MGANTLKAHLKHLHDHAQAAYLKEAEPTWPNGPVAVPDHQEKPMHPCPGSAPRSLNGPRPRRAPEGLSQLTQWPCRCT